MYLGLDLGTSELKGLLLSPDGTVVADAGAPLAISRPRPLWSEQDPADWWRALDLVMTGLGGKDAKALRRVRAIGLSGQMHGAVLLDGQDRVLRPAILWNDGRSEAQCRALELAVPALRDIAGNLAMPGFTAPKILWVRENEPETYSRTRRVLLPKDWLRFRLSGDFATDCSDASGTLWLDVGARGWSERLLRACGLTPEHMPIVVEGTEATGCLRGELARRWGLSDNVRIAGGGGDNAASAVGIGASAPGQGFVSLGTSGVIFVVSGAFLPNPESAVHAFCHALPGRWHQMSVMLSAASSLRWATALTGRAAEAELVKEAGTRVPAGIGAAPLFLPYLSGERTPHNDPEAQGVLFGLTHDHAPADVGYAVLEGVAFGLFDGFGALDASLRAQVEDLSLVGGGARSRLWGRLLASLLERPLVLREGGERAGALGAARLAWLADGGAEEDVCLPAPSRERIEPEAALREALLPRYDRYRALYPILRSMWSSRARLPGVP